MSIKKITVNKNLIITLYQTKGIQGVSRHLVKDDVFIFTENNLEIIYFIDILFYDLDKAEKIIQQWISE